MRLVSKGERTNAGYVEIYHDGEWGTICDDDWDLMDGDVVCKQLGFEHGAHSVIDGAGLGEGMGPIMLSSINCGTEETMLEDCPNSGWKTHSCSHIEDAGVICRTDPGRNSFTRITVNISSVVPTPKIC